MLYVWCLIVVTSFFIGLRQNCMSDIFGRFNVGQNVVVGWEKSTSLVYPTKANKRHGEIAKRSIPYHCAANGNWGEKTSLLV